MAYALKGVALASDPASLGRWLRLRRMRGGDLVALRLRPLGGGTVLVRPGTTDAWVAAETLPPALHLPGAEVDHGAARLVWDLGANIGVTMAHLAARMPQARVVGVELDAANARLAARNVLARRERCTVIRAGVWVRDGTVHYGGEVGQEVGFRIGWGVSAAPAICLNELYEWCGRMTVDYVKMDIEGAEREVLREATEWASHVRVIKVEVHPPYAVAECIEDLVGLGFVADVQRVPRRYNGKPAVLGVRGV